jgi:hypothetical protein
VEAKHVPPLNRKRVEQYKESLFSFIENDGVPWHNNAAERALRHLATPGKKCDGHANDFPENGTAESSRYSVV